MKVQAQMRLHITAGPQAGQTVEIPDAGIVFGRSQDHSDWVLVEPTASRSHCRVFAHEGKLVIQDQGSRNGTYLNGERIDAKKGYTLKIGAQIQIGSTVMLLQDHQPDVPCSSKTDVKKPNAAPVERKSLGMGCVNLMLICVGLALAHCVLIYVLREFIIGPGDLLATLAIMGFIGIFAFACFMLMRANQSDSNRRTSAIPDKGKPGSVSTGSQLLMPSCLYIVVGIPIGIFNGLLGAIAMGIIGGVLSGSGNTSFANVMGIIGFIGGFVLTFLCSWPRGSPDQTKRGTIRPRPRETSQEFARRLLGEHPEWKKVVETVEKCEKVWNANRDVVRLIILDENSPEVIQVIQEIPALIDDAIEDLVNLANIYEESYKRTLP